MEYHRAAEQDIVSRDIKEFESEAVKKDAFKYSQRMVMQN